VDFWPTPRWRISPYLAVAISGLSSKTSIRGGSVGNVPPQLAAVLSDWDANAWSLAGVLEVKYQRWTDTFNESLPVLDTSGWRNAVVVEAMWRTITDYRLFGRRIGFNAFVNNASFPGQEKDDLGFNWYFGLGGGIDVFLKQRIGKFARLDFVGLRGTGVVGSDVRGGGIALTFKPHRGPF
jgi:hypothetical protein